MLDTNFSVVSFTCGKHVLLPQTLTLKYGEPCCGGLGDESSALPQHMRTYHAHRDLSHTPILVGIPFTFYAEVNSHPPRYGWASPFRTGATDSPPTPPDPIIMQPRLL